MALVRAGGYGHRIVYVRPDEYVISWRYDTKIGRIRFQRGQQRDTDRRGAERFAKKWGINMPEDPR